MRIEFIRVRSSPENTRRLTELLPERLEVLRRLSGLQRALALKHFLFHCDLAVVLIWEKASASGRTREGVFLAEYLADFGLVEHSVWEQFPEGCADNP